MDKLVIGLAMACTAPIPDVLGGGAERLVTMLIDQNEISQRVKFVVFSKTNTKAKRISRRYKHSKFIYIRPASLVDKFINEYIKIQDKRGKKVLLKRGYYYRIAKRLKKNPVDFIIDENGYVPDILYLTNSVGRKKVSAHIHWMVKPKERGIEHLYGSAIGVSKYITNIWKDFISIDNMVLKTVYSAVDESRFIKKISSDNRDLLRERLGFKKEDCVFIYCGRIEGQKGALELLSAFLNLKNPDIGLLFVGGSDKKETSNSEYHQQIIEQAKYDTRIKFTGYVDNDEVYIYYQIADIQVIPTITEEAAGLVAIEGMISGLPIIATDSGGLPEYLKEDCSIIIKRDSELITGLTEAMNKLALNTEIRKKMSIASLNNGRQYTQSKYYNSFIDAIDEILREYAERDRMTSYDG